MKPLINLFATTSLVALCACSQDLDSWETTLERGPATNDAPPVQEPEESESEEAPDTAPFAVIVEPGSGEVLSQVESITLLGRVDDSETRANHLEVEWVSSLQGSLAVAEANNDGEIESKVTLEAGSHDITLNVVDEAGNSDSDEVSIEIRAAEDFDGDGDGYTPNDGDCDDEDFHTYPDAPETCDAVDNNCDGAINETWLDWAEPNDEEAVDLGALDSWDPASASWVTMDDLTFHKQDDIDFYFFDADDGFWDDISLYILAADLPAGGEFGVDLYLWEAEAWTLKVSNQGSENVDVEYEGSRWNTSEDYWLLAVYPLAWPEESCHDDYALLVSVE